MNVLCLLKIHNTLNFHLNHIADCQSRSQHDFNSDRETIRKQKGSVRGFLTVVQNRQTNCKGYILKVSEQTIE